MKKQIIIISTDIYPCKIGGLEIFNYHLFKNIEKDSDIDYQLFTTCKKAFVSNKNSNIINYNIFGFKRFGMGGLSGFISIILNSKIKIKNVDKIYIGYTSSFSSVYIIMLLLFKFFFNKKFILHIHGGGMKEWNNKRLNLLLFRNASKIAGVSELICSEYRHRSGIKIDLIPPDIPFTDNGIDKIKFKEKLGLSPKSKVILFVGSLKTIKSPEVVLKAFNLISTTSFSKHKPYLIFCGDGPDFTLLNELAKLSFYQKNIKFLGNIKNELIDDYYQISDIYVISSFFEGNPIALKHAMKRDLICIGSNVVGVNSLINNKVNGFLFKLDDVVELKNIFEDVLENFSLHKENLNSNKKINIKYQDFIVLMKNYLKK